MRAWATVAVLVAGVGVYELRPDARAVRSARRAVLGTLRDPASAEFSRGWHHVREGELAGTVCGSVNARNGFGGMSGWRAFLVSPAGVVLYPEEEPRDERVMELVTRCE